MIPSHLELEILSFCFVVSVVVGHTHLTIGNGRTLLPGISESCRGATPRRSIGVDAKLIFRKGLILDTSSYRVVEGSMVFTSSLLDSYLGQRDYLSDILGEILQSSLGTVFIC